MYFEPAKKTYYRFPSMNSINDLDSKLYFPEKTHVAGEETSFDAKSKEHSLSRNTYYNI